MPKKTHSRSTHRTASSKARTRRRTPVTVEAPPVGLAAAFAMTTSMYHTDAHDGAATAADVYPHAKQIVVKILHGQGDGDPGLDVGAELARAADRLFPAQNPPGCCQSDASFLCGFGVCWLLMTALGGTNIT